MSWLATAGGEEYARRTPRQDEECIVLAFTSSPGAAEESRRLLDPFAPTILHVRLYLKVCLTDSVTRTVVAPNF